MKKPWTPDHCPLQVGSVVYDPHTNSDRMVTRRYLSYEDNHTNEDKALVKLDESCIYTGKELMELGFTYYPEWPCTLDEKPCYDEVEDEPDIIKLAQCVFNGLKESKYAVKSVHYKEDGSGGFVWEDDIHNKVSGIITELADVFKENKHDEQQ